MKFTKGIKVNKEGKNNIGNAKKRDTVKNRLQNQLLKNKELLKAKEIWLDELQNRKTNLGKIGAEDKKVRNHRMFEDDVVMFY